MHIRKRTTCRVCGSPSLTPVIDLGPQYLQGSFVKPGKEMPSQRKINCSLVRCNPQVDENACGLLQMEHSVPPEILYAAYWYRSGTNATMRNHLKDIVDTTLSLLKKENSNVLDIGCGSGILLFACLKESPTAKGTGIDIYDPYSYGGSAGVFWKNAEIEGIT